MISAIHKRLQEKEEGFTLIELLVVVIIIGILAAIAIPVFLAQRERAWSRAAQSDLRNAAVLIEDHFSDAGTYAGWDGSAANTSPDVTLSVPTGTATTYCIQAVHGLLDAAYPNTYHLISTSGSVSENACP